MVQWMVEILQVLNFYFVVLFNYYKVYQITKKLPKFEIPKMAS